MIHSLSAAGVLAAVAALAGVTYRVAGKVVGWRLLRSALAGVVAAGALTAWVGVVRHAALVASAAQPLRDGQKLTPGFILESGFAATFLVATVAVLAISAVLDARRARRAWRQDGSASGRRARRAPVRGW
jgi:hypothetical protein